MYRVSGPESASGPAAEPSRAPVRHHGVMKFVVTVACSLIAVAALACGDGGRNAATPSSIAPTATARTTGTPAPVATPTPPIPAGTPVPATPTAPPSAASGVEGYVTIGPQCPVVQEGSPCPDAPFEASLTLVDPVTGATVASGRSDASGRFRLDAPPGTYRLVPESFGALPYASEMDVTVPASGYVQVAVQYDSGIR